jgi:WD40 repeat protein
MQARAAIVAILLAAAPVIASSDVRGDFTLSEAEKIELRPICADQTARDKVVAEQIANGGEHGRLTAKWDMDIDCEQLDLPSDPLHDTADLADEASHNNWIYDARWSPDGKMIVTTGRDRTVRIWDVATGKTIWRIDIGGIVRNARFIDDGRAIIVTADAHPIPRVFDVASGEPVSEVPYVDPNPSAYGGPFVEASASGLLVLGVDGGDVSVYDLKAKAERYRLKGVANHCPSVAISDAAGLLAITFKGTDNARVQVVKLATGEPVWAVEFKGVRQSAGPIALSRDGTRLAVSVAGSAHIYDVADKRLITSFLTTPYFNSGTYAFTADGKGLVSCFKHAMLFDIASGTRVHHFGPFLDLCHSVDVSPDGKYLATGHIGSDARIWEVETGTFYRRLGKNVHPPS